MAAIITVESIPNVEDDPYYMLSNDELKRICKLYDIDIASNISREELLFLLNEYVKH